MVAYLVTALFGLLYFGAVALAFALARFQGGVACFWVAAALLLARLLSRRRAEWPATLALCWAGGMLATGLFGIGWAAAAPLSAVNVCEAVVAALLISRWRGYHDALESLPQLLRFVVVAGLLAPLITAPIGAAIVTRATGTPFARNVLNWTIGHALGAVTFTPIFALILTGELIRWSRALVVREVALSAAILLLVALTASLVFLQSRFPILFMPAFPLILATFRMGRVGAACGVVLVAIIGGVLTLHGLGPISLVRGSVVTHMQFFQFYLAMTLLTVLPVAADLTRRRQLYAELRDSEARLRVIMEHSSDIVLSQRRDGSISYISPSVAQQIAHRPADLAARGMAALLTAADLARVELARAQALDAPEESFTVEFMPPAGINEDRWFEMSLRAVVDADGTKSGTVGTIREVTRRKLRELALTQAAETDALTGLANRRAFDERLSRTMLQGRSACLALLDLDHFKAVNDRHGHGVGDQVLKLFTARVRHGLKDGDLLARIGGEEFAVLFEGATLGQAAAACERIRALVADEPLRVADCLIRITASAGIADLRAATDAGAAMRNADMALYRAKARGRNRSEIATETMPAQLRRLVLAAS